MDLLWFIIKIGLGMYMVVALIGSFIFYSKFVSESWQKRQNDKLYCAYNSFWKRLWPVFWRSITYGLAWYKILPRMLKQLYGL